MRLYDKIKINNKKACIIGTVRNFYSFIIKHVHSFLRHDLARATKCC